jgi:3-oxoacyl-[acyl-carrier protein] reductase
MSIPLAGQVAVVTGASKGIGAEIARQVAAAGAAVVVHFSSDPDGADHVVSKIAEAGGTAVAIRANLSNPGEIKRLFGAVAERFGKLDLLVNNAGVYEFGAVGEITPEHYHRVFDVNVLGLLLATQEAVALFPPSGGNIVNVSSVAAQSPLVGGSVYSASKAAVDAITKAHAKELGSRQIRVNAVSPGMVNNRAVEGVESGTSEFQRLIESQTPLGRIGLPADVAPAVVFLASKSASWITGEVLVMSGGFC